MGRMYLLAQVELPMRHPGAGLLLVRSWITHTHPSINVPPHIVILAILFDMNFNLEGEYFIFPLTC